MRHLRLLILHLKMVMRLFKVVAVTCLRLRVDPLRDLGDKGLVFGACWLITKILLELLCDKLRMLRIFIVELLNSTDDAVLHQLRRVQILKHLEVILLPSTLLVGILQVFEHSRSLVSFEERLSSVVLVHREYSNTQVVQEVVGNIRPHVDIVEQGQGVRADRFLANLVAEEALENFRYQNVEAFHRRDFNKRIQGSALHLTVVKS
jgi:hypothetical protein